MAGRVGLIDYESLTWNQLAIMAKEREKYESYQVAVISYYAANGAFFKHPVKWGDLYKEEREKTTLENIIKELGLS